MGDISQVLPSESGIRLFYPPDLPPGPPIGLLPLQNKLVRAGKALGILNAVSDALPDNGLFLYYYVRKEAVLSSQIEGTQSSLSDLLLYESNETDLQNISKLNRPAIRAKKVQGHLCQRGIVNVKDVAESLEITAPTARSALNDLKKLDIVQDIKGSGRERIYVYAALIQILDKGAEPISYS